ncbi:MAG: LptF/LptG family permease [Candidatus Omnitrophota bacterium]
MLILQRYVFKALLLPFGLALLVLNFIFMGGYFVKAANLIIGRGVPITDTFYVLLLALPEMLGYTVPTSILLAVLIVFGTLSQNNELRAVKASGINLLRVIVPALILGGLLSLGMFVFNDQVASNMRFELRKTMKRMVIKFPKALIEPGRFVRLSDSIIFRTAQMVGDELRDIVAYEVEANDKPVRTIIAESGDIYSQPGEMGIQIRLYNGSISEAQNEGVNTIQFKTYEFPTFGQQEIRTMEKKQKDFTLAEMLLQNGQENMDLKDRRRLWTAFHGRIAFAMGSFLFVLIGIPVAILVHRGEIVLSFGLAMAATSTYYILFAGAQTLALQGILPIFLALWIPNAVLFAIGIILLRRSLIG